MRRRFLPNIKSLADKVHSTKALISVSLMTLLLGFGASAQEQTYHQEDPMESRYSKTIRAEYTKCREKKDPTTQFFCTCKLLEEQCAAPRRLEHGNWNTVEFWPSNDPSEREVQFILFPDFDFLGDFAPINKGIIMTCMGGVSEVNIFVGDNVDSNVEPEFYIGETAAKARFIKEDKLFTFDEPEAVYAAFEKGEDVMISYTDLEDIERVLEFDTYGFDHVSKGWEKLCKEKSS